MRLIHKGVNTPNPHQETTAPPDSKHEDKSSQIFSNHTRKDRCTTSLQPASPPRKTPTLITALNTHLTWVKPAEKPRKLTLAQGLKITLISYRHNLTQEALAHLFEVSQPTISRTISTIEKSTQQGTQTTEQTPQ